ncbi:MAG: NHLP leader peptide family RiPP precursor [Phycisphaerales bacterium]|nr:NHLP leader peptide family RiPP precursor [Phycisphaerales bacterium]
MSEQREVLSRVLGNCWKSGEFKARFITDPKGVLAEAGMAISDGIKIDVVENTSGCVYITLPADLSGEDADGSPVDESVRNELLQIQELCDSFPALRLFLSHVLEACARDPKLNARFMEQPRDVLEEFGLKPPPTLAIKVLQNTESMVYFVLPAGPFEYGVVPIDELSDSGDDFHA